MPNQPLGLYQGEGGGLVVVVVVVVAVAAVAAAAAEVEQQHQYATDVKQCGNKGTEVGGRVIRGVCPYAPVA